MVAMPPLSFSSAHTLFLSFQHTRTRSLSHAIIGRWNVGTAVLSLSPPSISRTLCLSHSLSLTLTHTPTLTHTGLWNVGMAAPKPPALVVSYFVAVCCSVLQCVAVCYSALQCVAVRCSALQCIAVRCEMGCCSELQYFSKLEERS